MLNTHGHLQGPMTLTPVAGRYNSRYFTTCPNDLGMSRLGLEYQPFRIRSERYYRVSGISGKKKTQNESAFYYHSISFCTNDTSMFVTIKKK